MSSCEANAFSQGGGFKAHEGLLVTVAEYFQQGSIVDLNEKIHMSNMPPVYFQHQGLLFPPLIGPERC